MRVTEHWRLNARRYELMGSREGNSESVNFPPRPSDVRDVEYYDFNAPLEGQDEAPIVEEAVK